MRILIAGDFCPCYRVAQAFEKEDYASVLSEVSKVTSNVDYSIVNLECPIVVGSSNSIKKKGPRLRCGPKVVSAIKYAGFNCVTLANNHFLDYGKEGVEETICIIDAQEVDHVGGGRNLKEASRVLYKDIAGQRLAVINCCEHEFSIASENTAGSNPLNPVQQYYAIKEARNKSDKVLVIVHGGHEHFQLPSPRMVETYRFFIDAGADAVVNHHQHCYSGYEMYKEKPIFYGLGNFCFDNPAKHNGFWTEGYMVEIDFATHPATFSIHPYRQCTDTPAVELVANDIYDGEIHRLNAIISDAAELKREIEEYYAKGCMQYSSIFEPFYNRCFRALRYKGWIPSFIGEQRILSAKDFVSCEAHRDKLLWWLNKQLNN